MSHHPFFRSLLERWRSSLANARLRWQYLNLGTPNVLDCFCNIASLTMSAVSSTFRAHSSMHSEERAISLSLKMCRSNQSSLAISFRSPAAGQ